MMCERRKDEERQVRTHLEIVKSNRPRRRCRIVVKAGNRGWQIVRHHPVCADNIRPREICRRHIGDVDAHASGAQRIGEVRPLVRDNERSRNAPVEVGNIPVRYDHIHRQINPFAPFIVLVPMECVRVYAIDIREAKRHPIGVKVLVVNIRLHPIDIDVIRVKRRREHVIHQRFAD
jgi:hypothetical protein